MAPIDDAGMVVADRSILKGHSDMTLDDQDLGQFGYKPELQVYICSPGGNSDLTSSSAALGYGA